MGFSIAVLYFERGPQPAMTLDLAIISGGFQPVDGFECILH